MTRVERKVCAILSMFPQGTPEGAICEDLRCTRKDLMPLKPDTELMQRAIDLATQNVLSGGGGPFAALIVRDGKVIAEAVNTVTATYDPTAHGEVNAIRKACAQLKAFTLEGCEIYTSSEPCPMCLAAIYWARIQAIYFGNTCEDAARAGFDDSRLYQQVRLDQAQRAVPTAQVLHSEAWSSFQAWLDTTGRIDY